MKFVKGMFIGGLVTTGIMMMYLENENKAKEQTAGITGYSPGID